MIHFYEEKTREILHFSQRIIMHANSLCLQIKFNFGNINKSAKFFRLKNIFFKIKKYTYINNDALLVLSLNVFACIEKKYEKVFDKV